MTWWYNFYAAWKCRQDWNDKESGNLQSHLFLYLTHGDSCFSYRLINTGLCFPLRITLLESLNRWTKASLTKPWCLGKRYGSDLNMCDDAQANMQYRYICKCICENFLALWLPMLYANNQTCFLCRNSCGVRSGTRGYIHEQDGAQAIQVPNCTTGNYSSHKVRLCLMIMPYM